MPGDDAGKELGVGGRRSAAPADDADPVGNHLGHRGGVLLGPNTVDRLAVLYMRETGVGLHHDGFGGNAEHALHKGANLGRAERAVDADDIGPERVERYGGHFGRGPEEGAPVRLKGHGGKDGQARLLLCGEHRSAHLGEVGHGLDDDEIRPGLLGGARHAGKLAVRLVKAHRAERPQQRAERPDIAAT